MPSPIFNVMDSILHTDSSSLLQDEDQSNVPDSDNNVKLMLPFQHSGDSNSSSLSASGTIAGDEKEPIAENEVFVGGVGKTVTEEDLFNVFSIVGQVRQVRLMKDKSSGESKGYAFVSFNDKSLCQVAVEKISNKELKGKCLRVKFSENRRKIFIGNLPKELSKDQLLSVLNKHSEGVTAVDFLTDPDNSTRNRGFAFIEYSDHYLAEKARKEFSSPSFMIGNSSVTVNWADPVQEPDEGIMRNVKVLYIRNLPEHRSEDELKSLFAAYGTVEKVIVPVNLPGQQRRDFGFIHFEDRDAAEDALRRHSINPINYQGRDLIISFAKPMDKKQRAELRVRKLQRTVNRQHLHQKQLHQLVPTIGMAQNLSIQPGLSFFQLQSAPSMAPSTNVLHATASSYFANPSAAYSLYASPSTIVDPYLNCTPLSAQAPSISYRYKPY
eukprot:gene8392-9872_t